MVMSLPETTVSSIQRQTRSMSETCEILGVSRSTVAKMIESGDLSVLPNLRTNLVTLASIEAILGAAA